MPDVGDRAPDFTLPADRWDREVSLGDYADESPVALFFYPGDWSSVCTDQMDVIQQNLDEFERRGTRVLAVSADSPWSHRAWAEQRGLSFPLLADFQKEVSRSYGVLREQGFPDRAYFIIDSSGVIRARKVEESPSEQPGLEEVLSDLDAAL
jgi:peroxiredoxin